ncbi:thioredoxin-like protein [Xylaria palmicola]|nr:thioredoxin-like protein [Xylaria palmicola]
MTIGSPKLAQLGCFSPGSSPPLPNERAAFNMETVYYIILAFLSFSLVKALFFTDRSPIPETSGHVYKITEAAELRALLASTTYVVVDFYADWCPPCRAIAPIFSRLADTHASKGQLAFAKVNVDHVKNVAGQFNVTAMPTFLFFERGAPRGVMVDGIRGHPSVSFGDDGLVDRIRGADKVALEKVVQALAGKAGPAKE